jgi:hypothetical protein
MKQTIHQQEKDVIRTTSFAMIVRRPKAIKVSREFLDAVNLLINANEFSDEALTSNLPRITTSTIYRVYWNCDRPIARSLARAKNECLTSLI